MIRTLSLALLIIATLAPVQKADAAKDKVISGTAHVIDAGTIAVDDKILRLWGIITPGPRQKCKTGALPWLCGAAARSYLGQMIDGKKVKCRWTGNQPARCSVNGQDVGLAMVSAGWAIADEQGSMYRGAEDSARTGKKGMWGKGG